MIGILLSLIIWGLVFWVLWWAAGALALPEPFAKVISVVLVLATIVVLIGLLQGSIAPFSWLKLR